MTQSDMQPEGRITDHLLAALGFLVCLALAAGIWRFGPAGLIPIHFDLHGRVNGRADRAHLALIMAGVTAFMALCYGAIGLLTGGARRNLRVARLIIVVVAVMGAAIMAAAAFGTLGSPGTGPSRLQPAILALFFLVMGALVGKAAPNPLVGMRTYWTFRSRLAWDKSNRLWGRLLFAVGVLGLIASLFAPPMQLIFALTGATLLSTLLAVVEGWRVWRTDPDRAGR